MGFEAGSLTKTKTISLHRAARRALEAMGLEEGRIERDVWDDYCARAGNVGSRTQAKNLNWRLKAMGLIQIPEEGGDVVVLPSDYSDILTEE